MKAYKYLPLLLTAFLAGCYKMDVPEPETPRAVVKLSLDGDPYAMTEPIEIDYETSQTLEFSYEDISRIVAVPPQGWDAQVKMSSGKGTLKISAPKYGVESVPSGELVLRLYDGSGSFKEAKFPVVALEGQLVFQIRDFDLSAVSEFTLGSRTTVSFDCSPSFKNIEFTLPAGWKAVERTRGTFTIIAPDLTTEEGDAEGTVTVKPVSWGGQDGSDLAQSFAVHVDATKPTFQFVEEETTFAYGETKELEIAAKGLRDLVTPEAPAGWTIDWSRVLDGIVTVTAPAKDAEGAAGSKELVLNAVSNADGSPITSNSSIIRLYGINSAKDVKDFRAVYEAESKDEPNTNPDDLAKWLVDGKLVLNDDFTLSTDLLTDKAYIIKTLRLSLEGNGHTITLDLQCSAAVAGIFQYIDDNVEVKNLKIAGSISNSHSSALSYIGPLAAVPMSCTIENVECSADITYDVGPSVLYKTVIGGIAGMPRGNSSPTFVNCKYTGTIHCKNDAFSVGGIVGGTDTGKPGGITTVDHCVFSGNMIFDHQTADSGIQPRHGGMLGDLARQGVITDCENSGSITINADSKRFSYNSGCGIGGIVGRITAPASGYTMAATIKNATFRGTITLNNGASNEDKARYGQILGCSPSEAATNVLTKENWVEEGTISL